MGPTTTVHCLRALAMGLRTRVIDDNVLPGAPEQARAVIDGMVNHVVVSIVAQVPTARMAASG
jgi:hypothetical protein